jgi:hypothetical protein
MTSNFKTLSLLSAPGRNNLPGLFWTIALSIFAAITLLAGPALAAPDPFGGKFNHYQCYDAVDWSKLPEGAYKTKDQFASNEVKIVKPLFLCNPVDKNGEGIPAPEVHLLCYEVEQAKPDTSTYSVIVGNQVEENRYAVRKPHVLCVPSTKRHVR